MIRRYENPNILAEAACEPQWPIALTYRDEATEVDVEFGEWGSEGWIRCRYTMQVTDLPETIVAQKYRLTKQQGGRDDG